MAHEHRLPECEEKFKSLDGEFADMKRPKNGGGWAKYLVGVIVSLILFIVLPAMVNYSIASDKESRTRDSKIEEKQTANSEKQSEVNSKILSALSEISSDVRWLTKNKGE